MLSILGFLFSPLGKIIGIAGAVVSIVSILFITLRIHDHSIRTKALAEFNQKQLEQVIADNKAFNEKMKALTELQRQTVEMATKQKEDLDARLKELNDYLSSKSAVKSSRDSSVVLKKTIELLSKGR